MSNIWYAIDFETSDTNKYTCKFDSFQVLTFEMEPFKVLDSETVVLRDVPLRKRSWFSARRSRQANWVAHNFDFDVYLQRYRLDWLPSGTLHDTYIMAKHVNNLFPGFSLKALSWWMFSDPYEEEAKLGEWFRKNNVNHDMTLAPRKLVDRYCYRDVFNTARLAAKWWPTLKENYAYEQDMEALVESVKLEHIGVHIDRHYYEEFIRKGERRAR